MATPSRIAVAPAHPEGEHTEAYRKCPPFPLSAKIRMTSRTNPWRKASPGRKFHDEVLMGRNPKTVGEAIRYGEECGFKPRETMNHLRWLFTWGGGYIKIGGKQYADLVDSEEEAKESV